MNAQKNPHTDLILRWTAGLLLVVLNIVAVYLLLRGHNLPGGGFIGGLVSALSVLLYGLATGLESLEDRLHFDPLRVAAVGLLLGLGAACVAPLMGQPFFQHYQGYLEIPNWGKVYWGTPLLFDLGVMLLVLGIGAKVILNIARSMAGRGPVPEAQRWRYAARAEEPIEAPGQVEGGDDGR
jgi:multicomponent Na+:H+ antiporter subunit B